MAFSIIDQAAVEQAVRDLATGQRIVRITVNGKTTEYGQADLGALRGLLAEINQELAAIEPFPSYILTRTEKGL